MMLFMTLIVAVTAMDTDGVRTRASRAGMGSVLCKPLSRDAICAVLDVG
ncbi:MAG: CheY-like chemotaxis protein [Planctomycetota bacterium]|jgi:CheY-like chemotaxis protein